MISQILHLSFRMKVLILSIILITYTASQPEQGLKRMFSNIIIDPAFPFLTPDTSEIGDSSALSVAMDSSGSDTANVTTSSFSSIGKSAPAAPPPIAQIMLRTTEYDRVNNAWSSLQRLGGGCCDNCKKICGFAIKLHGTNRYLTNMSTWYQFRPSTNPNASQIFTMGQNADCTWSFSNRGSFLSTSSNFAGNWVGSAGTIGANERWYIERGSPYFYIQSASSQYWYWRASSFPNYFLGYSYGSASRLTMEYYPCDKNFGWNW